MEINLRNGWSRFLIYDKIPSVKFYAELKKPKLVLELYEIVGDKNFRVIGDNRRLKTIDKFFDIDFSELTKEQ